MNPTQINNSSTYRRDKKPRTARKTLTLLMVSSLFLISYLTIIYKADNMTVIDGGEMSLVVNRVEDKGYWYDWCTAFPDTCK